MSLETYSRLLHKAPDLEDYGDYTLNAGEMNPVIFSRFVQELVKHNLPKVVWEPFAGTSATQSANRSSLQDYAETVGVKLISYGLRPADERITIADSTAIGPNKTIGGMLFHPPYYGTMPMSQDKRDLSFMSGKTDYLKQLGLVIQNAIVFMVQDALACVVGRDYRANGERVRLDLMFLQLFESRGFRLRDVWKSTPDVVMIMGNNS